jgi:hypothetical protein
VFLKEIKDTLKQAGFIMAFLAVMPLVYLLDSSLYKTGVTFPEYIGGGFALLWMIAVGYLAYNMFRPEEKDNAVEYILSLPIARWKLLIWKTVPRIVVLLLANVIAKCLGVGYSWFWSFTGLLSFIVFSQVCGFALGIVGRKSWITRLMLFVMMICAFIINSMPPVFIWKEFVKFSSILPHPSAFVMWTEQVRFSQFPYILVELGFLALILIPLYRTWDLKPTRARELSFAKRSIIPMIILAFPVVWMFSS